MSNIIEKFKSLESRISNKKVNAFDVILDCLEMFDSKVLDENFNRVFTFSTISNLQLFEIIINNKTFFISNTFKGYQIRSQSEMLFSDFITKQFQTSEELFDIFNNILTKK